MERVTLLLPLCRYYREDRHCVQTGSGAYPASFPVGTGKYYSGSKTAGAWMWPLTSI